MNKPTKKVLRWYDDKKELFLKRDAMKITENCLELVELKNKIDVEYYTLSDDQLLLNIAPVTNALEKYDTYFLLMDVDWSASNSPDDYLQKIIEEIENDSEIVRAYIIFYSCVYDKNEVKERTKNISVTKCEIIGHKCMYSGTKGLLRDSMLSVCKKIKQIIIENEGEIK